MISTSTNEWQQANQASLSAAIRLVFAELGQHANAQALSDSTVPSPDAAEQELAEAESGLPAPAAYEVLSQRLSLSAFERKVLLLCAGIELDASLAALVGRLLGNIHQPLPSFGLALAAFEDAHWSAVSPDAPLRRWQLLRVTDPTILTRSPLAIDEQILQFITGNKVLDSRLTARVTLIPHQTRLADSQLQIAARVAAYIAERPDDSPVVLLDGDLASAEMIATAAARTQGFRLFSPEIRELLIPRGELLDWIRIWNREACIQGYAMFVDASAFDGSDPSYAAVLKCLSQEVTSPLFVCSNGLAISSRRSQVTIQVSAPGVSEREALWRSHLGPTAAGLNGQITAMSSQFALNAASIAAISQQASVRKDHPEALAEQLWTLCRTHTRPEIDALAQRIVPLADWDDLILPEAQLAVLRELSLQVRHRTTVYDNWGFEKPGARGLGITAMFFGESGTGKTMAAEVLARELQLDLYRIDLSQVVNKYIGETEKNLKRIFDAAEQSSSILLFDEADALFGKRSEVKDSHDRYGNIEVSYLLQRMESYRGLAILTTNMKSALDKAFLRRIRFVVQFPFPGAPHRSEIWRRVFPESTPLSGLDYEKLGRLSVSGGNIRNIALNAAFMAAADSVEVGMPQILRAARLEYQKLEKPMNGIEIDGL